jgi:hypothetical protein
MKENEFNWNEVFVVRPTNTEENDFMITIGNRLATTKRFKTAKAAQLFINKKPWELIATLVFACNEMIKTQENENQSEQTNQNDSSDN